MALNDLVVNIAGNAQDFQKTAGEVRGGLLGLSAAAAGVRIGFTGLVASLAPLATMLAPLAAAFALFKTSASSIGLAAEAEQTAIAFQVMTGSIENAQALVAELRTMGAKTPFEFVDLAKATKTLLNFGRTQDQVLKDLDVLGNIASGDAEKLDRLALVFGQISAEQKLTGENLNQLIDIGFNPLQQIVEKTGESMAELRKRMSQGKIGLAEVQAAFEAATSEGGRFFQMNEKQSQTLLGRWSAFKDNLSAVMMEVGNAIIEAFDFKGILAETDEFIQKFRSEWMPQIRALITHIGDLFRSLVGFLGDIWKGWVEDTVKDFAFLATEFKAVMKVMALEWELGWDAMLSTGRDFWNGFIDTLHDPFGLGWGEGHWAKIPEQASKQAQIFADLQKARQELAKAAEEFEKKFKLPELKLPELPERGPKPTPESRPAPVSRQDLAPNRSFEVGTQAAFEKIFAVLSGTGDKKKPEKQTADNTKEANKLLTRAVRILEEVERKIGKVEEVEFIA